MILSDDRGHAIVELIARSLAPALLSGNFDSLWIYLTAPVLGAGLAIPLCLCIQDRPCCCAPPREACP